MFKGDEEKLKELKNKSMEIENLKKEFANFREDAEESAAALRKSLQDKINLLESDLDGLRRQKKEAEGQASSLKRNVSELQEELDRSESTSLF
jgi:chromosome segregation ATPase